MTQHSWRTPPSLYRCYLAVDLVERTLADIEELSGDGVVLPGPMSPHITRTRLWGGSPSTRAAITYWHHDFRDGADRRAERLAEQMLERLPQLHLERKEGRIGLYGEIITDVEVYFHLGDGVCERVQVGTKSRTEVDPDWLAEAVKDAPMVTIEEPVYEVVCPDPIVAAGLTS